MTQPLCSCAQLDWTGCDMTAEHHPSCEWEAKLAALDFSDPIPATLATIESGNDPCSEPEKPKPFPHEFTVTIAPRPDLPTLPAVEHRIGELLSKNRSVEGAPTNYAPRAFSQATLDEVREYEQNADRELSRWLHANEP